MALDSTKPSIYPVLRYRDAPAAIRFLTSAFGLSEHYVVPGEGDTITHAQLAWGSGLVMLGSSDDTDDPDGPDTSRPILYLASGDVDAHYARAVAAGAQIVMELSDQDYGSREYSARDSEGNVWSFGSYQPGPEDS